MMAEFHLAASVSVTWYFAPWLTVMADLEQSGVLIITPVLSLNLTSFSLSEHAGMFTNSRQSAQCQNA